MSEPFDVGGVPSEHCENSVNNEEVFLQSLRHLINKVESMMEHSPLVVPNRIWQVLVELAEKVKEGHRAEAIGVCQLLAAPVLFRL